MVAGKVQRQGVGRALLDTATDWATSASKTPILDVVTASAGAIAFYEALGWERVGPIDIAISESLSIPALVFELPHR